MRDRGWRVVCGHATDVSEDGLGTSATPAGNESAGWTCDTELVAEARGDAVHTRRPVLKLRRRGALAGRRKVAIRLVQCSCM